MPVKKLTNLGDGVFFSVCMTLGVFTVGVVVCLARSFPKFEYQAMFGGSLWAIGNLCVVPIVKSIGLALGMMIWSGACMLSGWASARFGILGLDKEEVSMPGLNGFGVALACLALYVASKIDGTTNSNSNSSSSSNSNSTSGMRRIDVDEEREDNAFLNKEGSQLMGRENEFCVSSVCISAYVIRQRCLLQFSRKATPSNMIATMKIKTFEQGAAADSTS